MRRRKGRINRLMERSHHAQIDGPTQCVHLLLSTLGVPPWPQLSLHAAVAQRGPLQPASQAQAGPPVPLAAATQLPWLVQLARVTQNGVHEGRRNPG